MNIKEEMLLAYLMIIKILRKQEKSFEEVCEFLEIDFTQFKKE